MKQELLISSLLTSREIITKKQCYKLSDCKQQEASSEDLFSLPVDQPATIIAGRAQPSYTMCGSLRTHGEILRIVRNNHHNFLSIDPLSPLQVNLFSSSSYSQHLKTTSKKKPEEVEGHQTTRIPQP
jgi:hypothetical protein